MFSAGSRLLAGALTKGVLYLAINLVGVVIFLCFDVSARQMRLREEREYYDAGDSIAFITFCGPVLLICLLFNFVLFLKAGWEIYRHKDFRKSVALIIIIILLWAVARECTSLLG